MNMQEVPTPLATSTAPAHDWETRSKAERDAEHEAGGGTGRCRWGRRESRGRTATTQGGRVLRTCTATAQGR